MADAVWGRHRAGMAERFRMFGARFQTSLLVWCDWISIVIEP
jgi:hypothetical protein